MSAQGIRLVIGKIASDLIGLAQAVLEDDIVGTNYKVTPPTNTLKNSALHDTLARVIDASGDPVITALFNNYVVYIEWTRPREYKKRPPISALKEWAENAGIPTDAGTLYAISYAIWRDGHQGRPIFATLDKLTDARYNNLWADQLFNAVTADLDLLFND